MIWALKHENYFSDVTKLPDLLSGASQYLIADHNFDLLEFATDMKAFSGHNLSFTTLPSAPTNNVTVPGYPSPQSVNYIDVPGIQRAVNAAFYGVAAPAPAASSVTADVYNGSGQPGLAGEVSAAFAALGYKAGQALDSTAQSEPVTAGTQVFYGAGAELNAKAIANDMGTTATAVPSLPADHVEVLLGSTVTALPPGLLTYGAATVTAQEYASVAAADGLATAASAQSVSAAVLGARASSAGAADTASAAGKATPKPAKTPSAGDQAVTVSSDA